MSRVFRKSTLRQDLTESGLELSQHSVAKRSPHPFACYAPRPTPRRILLLTLSLTLIFLAIYALPPSYSDVRKLERALPQHDLELQHMEGNDGRYLRFPGFHKGVGWNNVLEEM